MFAPSDHSTTSTPPDRPNTLDPHWITELLPFLACTHRLNTFPSRLHDYTADIRRAEELVNEPIVRPLSLPSPLPLTNPLRWSHPSAPHCTTQISPLNASSSFSSTPQTCPLTTPSYP
ncbi:hypothetical protein K469DRAFT_706589 [Zopfia rhizophila CBS 207.26]|uniref:Uncharacterized protein n=1 Tax=Zopfia rhizophila CBS 207.26 TaxID=1314779 RepID=A0A6A6E9T9_9PEZI|nr:hypothetical protein K469DRAFT_706589 [Zopfia rhizophila CBS 207.26]